MATYQQINLKTAAGTLRLSQREPAEEFQCGLCAKDSDQCVHLTSTTDAGAEFTTNVCANCLAKGLAIAAGNSYVSADGDVDDLRFDEHWFADGPVCLRCGRAYAAIEKSGEKCSGRAI